MRKFIHFFCYCTGVLLVLNVLHNPLRQSAHEPDSINYKNYPYLHVLDQLKWISNSPNKDNVLSLVKPPKLYYDKRLLYHVTESNGCRYECTFPKTIFDLDKGDVAVFSDQFVEAIVEELKSRGVLVVFETAESPLHMRKLTNSQADLIDMFITYMPWSEVPFMYPMFIHNHNPENTFSPEEVTAMRSKNNTYLLPDCHYGRKKKVAWMVSNGQPKNLRETFARMLSQYIPVDIYGEYGMETPPGRDPFEWMSTQYKFYLALENSDCRFYITEKATSNAMRHNMVPIVMGAHKEDYAKVLPPHSYINVDDFKTIYELANYLQYLDRNHTAYAEHFAWKAHGRIHTRLPIMWFCASTKCWTYETKKTLMEAFHGFTEVVFLQAADASTLNLILFTGHFDNDKSVAFFQ